MAWKLFACVVVCVTVGAVAPDLVRGRSAAPPAAKFFDLRVCTYEAFSSSRGACTADQRGRKLVSSKFVCSVQFRPSRPETLRARIVYAGSVVTTFSARITDKRAQVSWIADDVGTTALPGGTWRCEFSFGSARTGATFASGGPTGPIVGASVCKGSDAVRRHGAPICRSDESGAPLRAPSEIACSAIFVNNLGKEAEIHLLSDGRDVDRPYLTKIRHALAVASVRFHPERGAQTFPPGRYVCRFSLEGRVIGKHFDVRE
jgi:hypothetical protein